METISDTSVIDAVRLITIVLGIFLFGTTIGYLKRYHRVQRETGLGLAGTRPLAMLLGAYMFLTLQRLIHHFYTFNAPATPALVIDPIVILVGIVGAVTAIKHMRRMENSGESAAQLE